MAAQGTIDWDGASGRKYTYWIYPVDESFGVAPGNYVFAMKLLSGSYLPVYAGETADLSERFDNHHKMACIRTTGATHIHVHTASGDDRIRRAEESDIVAKWHPPCNG